MNKLKKIIPILILLFISLSFVFAFTGTSDSYNVENRPDEFSNTNSTSSSFSQRIIGGVQIVGQYVTSTFNGRFGILGDDQLNLAINITSHNNFDIIVRGNDAASGEDDKGYVPNSINFTAKVFQSGTTTGYSGATCYFYNDGTLIGSASTNSSGDCTINFTKSTLSVSSRNISVNYSLITDDNQVVSWDSKNISIIRYVTSLTMGNQRSSGCPSGVSNCYIHGDNATLIINITKYNETSTFQYDPLNISANATNAAQAVYANGDFYYPSEITRTAVGEFNTSIVVNSSFGSQIRWDVIVSDNNYSSFITTAVHADAEICAGDFGAFSSWSACSSGTQTRSRTDSTDCTNVETQSCSNNETTTGGGGCTPQAWSEWSNWSTTCVNNQEIRTRSNGCTTETDTRLCGCTPLWVCNDWGVCTTDTTQLSNSNNENNSIELLSNVVIEDKLPEIEHIDYQQNLISDNSFVKILNDIFTSITGNAVVTPPERGNVFDEGIYRGEYFKNRDLSGTPVLVRDDPQIKFNWQGSPGRNVPKNDFSVRWTKNITLPAGTYLFSTTSDDGVRVYVGDRLVIDDWNIHWSKYNEAEVTLETGNYDLIIEFFDGRGEAIIEFNADLANVADQTYCYDGLPSGSCCPFEVPLYCDGGEYRPDCSICGCPENRVCSENGECVVDTSQFPGFIGEYYSSSDFSGSPALVRNDNDINFNWKLKSPDNSIPNNNFGARWTKNLDLPGGIYLFTTASDDGVRLYVDGNLLIDDWNIHTTTINEREVYLDAGAHKIIVEYFENSLNANIIANWTLLQPLIQNNTINDTYINGTIPEEILNNSQNNGTQTSNSTVIALGEGQILMGIGQSLQITINKGDQLSVTYEEPRNDLVLLKILRLATNKSINGTEEIHTITVNALIDNKVSVTVTSTPVTKEIPEGGTEIFTFGNGDTGSSSSNTTATTTAPEPESTIVSPSSGGGGGSGMPQENVVSNDSNGEIVGNGNPELSPDNSNDVVAENDNLVSPSPISNLDFKKYYILIIAFVLIIIGVLLKVIIKFLNRRK